MAAGPATAGTAGVALLSDHWLRSPLENVQESCQTCHKHKSQDLNELQAQWEALAKIPRPVGKPIDPIGNKQAPAKK